MTKRKDPRAAAREAVQAYDRAAAELAQLEQQRHAALRAAGRAVQEGGAGFTLADVVRDTMTEENPRGMSRSQIERIRNETTKGVSILRRPYRD